MRMDNKKGQINNGLIMGLVFGVAGLVILTIIAFIIVSTLTGAGLFVDQRTTATVTNETGGYINGSGYTLARSDGGVNNFSFTITAVYNETNVSGGELLPTLIAAGNYTVNSATGVVTNATATNWNDVINFSYTYTTNGNEETTVNFISNNFSAGVDNVSSKIPTVLLIAAIILILAILAVLVGVWQKMRMGGSI